MTTKTYCRRQWRIRYKGKNRPIHHRYPEHVQVVVVDFMQFVKSIDETIQTIRQLIDAWVQRIRGFFHHKVECVIVCFDKGTPPVKHVHCHVKSRYKNTKRYTAGNSPVLSSNLDKTLASMELAGADWMRLAGCQALLQREVYPLLWNALLNPNALHLKPGQVVVLHGLPSKTRQVSVHHGAAWENPHTWVGTQVQVTEWSIDTDYGDWPITEAMEQQDPEMYNRVYRLVGQPNGAMHVEEAPEWHNRIVEADNGVFWYQHFDCFKLRPTMISINDGDAVSIAVLQSRDRLNEHSEFLNHQYICLRYREPKEEREKRLQDPFEANKPPPTHEYVDVNFLHTELDNDPVFCNNNVNNPQAAFAMLNILCGSDFFTDYCRGIGERFIWNTFLQRPKLFSHLIQWNAASFPADPTAFRRAIVDETLFEQFTYYVYLNKYGKAVRKKNGGNMSFALLRTHCSKLKRVQNRMPTARQCKQFARQLQWNIQYWLNAPRNIEVDPFEQWRNMSYWGYQRNPETGHAEVSYVFSPKQKPMDEAYKRHLRKRKRKTRGPPTFTADAKRHATRVVQTQLRVNRDQHV